MASPQKMHRLSLKKELLYRLLATRVDCLLQHSLEDLDPLGVSISAPGILTPYPLRSSCGWSRTHVIQMSVWWRRIATDGP